jgi:xanthine dehydrogenase accessory factor
LGQKCALATIVEARGSIPSFESAKILVREGGSMTGTIGGGCVEAEVWNAAREVIQTEKPTHLNFNLGQDAAYDNGLICGGQLDVFVEPIMPVPHAFIFGAGHISKSLSKVATLAGFNSVVIDNRETFANRERFPEAVAVHADEYEEIFPRLAINETSYIIIVTRGHRDDMRVLQLAIATEARYIAMIGSKRKVLNVIRELEKQGIASSVRSHPCAYGAGHRGDLPRRDCHFRDRGDDRRPAEPRIQLARALAFCLEAGLRCGIAKALGAARPLGRFVVL